jgi:hypothetical protein
MALDSFLQNILIITQKIITVQPGGAFEDTTFDKAVFVVVKF